MNALRNLFGSRTLSLLRHNGQNALYNLTNDTPANGAINNNNGPSCVGSPLTPLQPLPTASLATSTGNEEQQVDGRSSTILQRFFGNSKFNTEVPPNTTSSIGSEAIQIPRKPLSQQKGQKGATISPRTLELCERMNRKLTIIYRCKLCNTRNNKQVNASAYRRGVVILQCDGCAVNHVIIDHLGWFIDTKGKTFQDVIDDHSSQGKPIKVIRINEKDEFI